MNNMEQEIWKDIPGYEGLYKLSNIGNFMSLDRACDNGRGKYVTKGQLIKSHKVLNHYYIKLWKNGKQKSLLLHRTLLTLFFSPPPSPRHYAMHLDDNPENNGLDNLRWGTPSENSKMAYANNKMVSPMKGRYGRKHFAAKPVTQYYLNGEIYKIYETITSAARTSHTPQQYIRELCIGKRDQYKGFRWRYDS